MTHTVTRHASPLVRTLEDAWATIRRNHPDVPDAVVILAPGTEQGRPGTVLGHYAPLRWQPAGAGDTLSEIMVAGESVALGVEEILNTLLHEAAHALGWARGVKNTSRQGRYHNSEFAALAREMGLTPPEAPCKRLGFSNCVTPEVTVTRYRRTLEALRKVATVSRVPAKAAQAPAPEAPGTPGTTAGGDPAAEPPRGNGNGIVLVCSGCGRKLRQRGKAERLTVCLTIDQEFCGIMTP